MFIVERREPHHGSQVKGYICNKICLMWTACHFLSDLEWLKDSDEHCLVEEYIYQCFFFFGLSTDFFVLRNTLRNYFGYWHEKTQQSFSPHIFLWRTEKVEAQNDQKKCFRQGKVQGRKWVSQPAWFSRLLQIIYLGQENHTFLGKLDFIYAIHFLKLMFVIFWHAKHSHIQLNMQRELWVDFL